MEGRVIQSTGKWYKVDTNDGIIESRLPGKFRLNKKEVTNPIAVGDRVILRMEEDGTGSITEILPRKNYIPRQATHGRRGEQILASNIDRAWAVQSIINPELNTGFIDRFLVTCEAYEVHGGIIINKTDLASDSDLGYINDLAVEYLNLGYPTIIISAEKKINIGKLIGELRNNTSVFIGPSGVGKTSILNKLEPDANFKVGEISSYSNKGKHTTTFARLVPLHFGGYIVDTPGVREFGLVQIEKSELSLYFPEMIVPRRQCRFNNCTHYHEPGCGVIAAYEEGKITASRYNSYLNILESLAT